jgi:hypothetical protein
MTALVDVIADFEKYLTPNRHLILEGGGLSEQAGHSTFKPITLYLFNDSVAMASKKARLVLSSAAKKLTLERLWLLNEVSVMDLPDTKSTLLSAYMADHVSVRCVKCIENKQRW